MRTSPAEPAIDRSPDHPVASNSHGPVPVPPLSGASAVAQAASTLDVAAGDARPASQRLRVVFVDHCAQRSGGELALARLLPALDVDAHVVLAEDGPFVELLLEAGATVEVLAMRSSLRGLSRADVRPGRLPLRSALATLPYTVKLARRLRHLRPDLVHTNSLKAALYGGIAGQLARVPVVWHVRDRIEADYLPRFAVRLVRAAARVLPTATIANSAATLATIHLPHDHFGVAVHSPDACNHVGPQEPRHATSGPLRVGILGRLAPWKGQHLFLDAFAQAFPGGDEQAVVVGSAMFGEESYGEEITQQAKRLGLENRVEFTGFRDDVGDELARLDVLVHASIIPEPFGQVVVEGMAAGVAVVAADAGGPAETITDGVDGLLYAMGDVADLGRRLQELAIDPALRLRLGDAGRIRAEDFSPEKAATAVMDVYRRTLDLSRRKGGESDASPDDRRGLPRPPQLARRT